MVITLARYQIFGSLEDLWHTENNLHSQSVAFSPWCKTNSGWTLSVPRDLFFFTRLMASVISLVEKSPERSFTTHGDLERSFTLALIFFMNE